MLYYMGKIKVHRQPTKKRLDPFKYTVYDSDAQEVLFYSKSAVIKTLRSGTPIKGLILAKTVRSVGSLNGVGLTKVDIRKATDTGEFVDPNTFHIMEESKGKYYVVNSPMRVIDTGKDRNYIPSIDIPIVIRQLKEGMNFRYKTLDVRLNRNVSSETQELTLYIKYAWTKGCNIDLYSYMLELEELYWCLKQYNSKIKNWVIATPMASMVDLHLFLPFVTKYINHSFLFNASLHGTTHFCMPALPRNMHLGITETTRSIEYLDIREFQYNERDWDGLLHSIALHTCLQDDCVILVQTDDLDTLTNLFRLRIPYYTYYCFDDVNKDDIERVAKLIKSKYVLMHKNTENEHRCFVLNVKG